MVVILLLNCLRKRERSTTDEKRVKASRSDTYIDWGIARGSESPIFSSQTLYVARIRYTIITK